ncbi:MAG: NapC/NirT family cytochrome c [Acidobacteriia bacterium]|nr:NapC/NirT family cytochrome c [Terriglobia bacterium]
MRVRKAGRVVHVAALALTPLLLRAQEISRFQRDPVEHFGARLLAAVIVIGIAVVLYSLVRYRGRTLSAASWGVLALGVGVLPVVSSGVGTVLVFERAERVEFCESCHLTMQAFVSDMKNPKSESLAALHYKNRYIPDDQCYICHTSYGLFGTVEAKKEGMHDVWVYYTRTFKLPVKLRHPYPNTDCLKCHAESVKWLGVHDEFKASLFSGETSCMQCHGATNPAHNVPGEVKP